MLQYRVIQNLKNLNRKEISEFQKWLKPGWTNSTKKLGELFEVLKAFYPNFSAKRLDKVYLYEKIYPGKKFHEKELLNLLSKLSTSIEEFLVHKYLRANSEERTDLLIQVKEHRKSSRDREIKLIEAKIKRLEAQAVKSTEDLDKLIKYYQFKVQIVNPKSGDVNKQRDFLKIQLYLDQYYALLKARNAMELLERESQLNEEHEHIPWYEQLPASCTEHPVILFYKQYEEYAAQMNLTKLNKLKDRFEEIQPNIPTRDQRIIYLLLVNAAARLKRRGLTAILKQTMELNQLAVQQGFILDNGVITPHSFANVINVACQQKQFSFAQAFLNDYNKYLPVSMQKDGMEWGQLIIDYKQGIKDAFWKAKKLEDHTRSYTIFSLRIRVLITQILFDAYVLDELEAYERFDKYIIAFNQKLLREKIYPQKQIESLKIFHDYCKKLASYYPDFRLTKAEAEALRQKVHLEKQIHAKQWILGKIDKMEKGDR
ncbi:MAG: hypothetical protein HRU41_08185 [Saprospiraceae bacterium]|nr:hypothetical protein [Saprospiraceae bacterium]